MEDIDNDNLEDGLDNKNFYNLQQALKSFPKDIEIDIQQRLNELKDVFKDKAKRQVQGIRHSIKNNDFKEVLTHYDKLKKLNRFADIE